MYKGESNSTEMAEALGPTYCLSNYRMRSDVSHCHCLLFTRTLLMHSWYCWRSRNKGQSSILCDSAWVSEVEKSSVFISAPRTFVLNMLNSSVAKGKKVHPHFIDIRHVASSWDLPAICLKCGIPADSCALISAQRDALLCVAGVRRLQLFPAPARHQQFIEQPRSVSGVPSGC